MFYEGSEMIDFVTPGGLDAFRELEADGQEHFRECAIERAKHDCIQSGKAAVVAGRFMSWSEDAQDRERVHTKAEMDTFTHILYLDVPAEIVVDRRQNDLKRNRPEISASHVRKWQGAEKTEMRRLCCDHGILFSALSPNSVPVQKLVTLLYDFRQHSEWSNLDRAKNSLGNILDADKYKQKTMLLMDADKALAPEDIGTLFWKKLSSLSKTGHDGCALKALFSSPLGYSYNAFRQAMLLYEEVADGHAFDSVCQEAASAVTIHPEFVTLLQLAAEQHHVGGVVVTVAFDAFGRKSWTERVCQTL